MDRHHLFDSLDDSGDENYQFQLKRPEKKPFKICDSLCLKQFQRRFRLSGRQFEILLRKIGPRLCPLENTNNALTECQKLLLSLRFYASNDWYYELSDFHGPSEATIMRAIKQVTFLLIDELLHIINWPPNIDGCRKIAEGFFRMGGMPKIGGCVDGTVVPINPPRLSGSAFKGKDNVKGIKVLGVCDSNNRFLFLSANFPARVHDQRVLRKDFAPNFNAGWRPFPDCVLLGDSGFASTDWLLRMQSGHTEGLLGHFYSSFARTRCSIEQLFGIWKARFSVLSSTMRFRDPVVAGSVIMAVGILQNFIVMSRNEDENDDADFMCENEINGDSESEDDENYEPEVAVETPNARERLLNHIQLFRRANNL